jgi:hypothetical protein
MAGGLLLVAIGTMGRILLGDLPIGTSFRIGPAFLPTGVSWMIAIIGAWLVLRSLLVQGPAIEAFKVRPLFTVLLAFAAFGLLIETAGLVVASVVLILISTLGAERFEWKHTIVLAILLTAFAVILFSVFLRLPMQVWPQWT